MTDGEKVERVAEIFRVHGTTIRDIVKRHVYREIDVDDVCQEIFLSMVHSPPSRETSLLAYFDTVAKNHVRDSHRRANTRRRVMGLHANSTTNGAVSGSSEDHADRKEQIDKVKMLIQSALPPYIARVVVERYAHQRSVPEIASILKIKKTSVSRYCSIGLRRLRRLMTTDEDTA